MAAVVLGRHTRRWQATTWVACTSTKGDDDDHNDAVGERRIRSPVHSPAATSNMGRWTSSCASVSLVSFSKNRQTYTYRKRHPHREQRRMEHGLANIVKGGTAELLLTHDSLLEYLQPLPERESPSALGLPSSTAKKELRSVAMACRESFWTQGYAHIPNFIGLQVVDEMIQEATRLFPPSDGSDDHNNPCSPSVLGGGGGENNREATLPFYSTESHNIYQEDHDPSFSNTHPRNALQQSSKWIVDYAKLSADQMSPLKTLYASLHLRSFVSFVVSSPEDKREPQSQGRSKTKRAAGRIQSGLSGQPRSKKSSLCVVDFCLVCAGRLAGTIVEPSLNHSPTANEPNQNCM
jgi:hypothetical protein